MAKQQFGTLPNYELLPDEGPLGGAFVVDESTFAHADIEIETKTGMYDKGLGGAAVYFTLHKPKDSQEITDPTPFVSVHGYCGFEVLYEEFAKAIAQNGRPAITYSAPRIQPGLTSLNPKHVLHPERLLTQAVIGVMRGSRELLATEGYDFDRFDLSGHSMGGRSATAAALLKPHEVRSVVLHQAAGLEEHNLPMMLSRIPAFLRKELIPAMVGSEFAYKRTRDIVNQVRHYILDNPTKTVVEGVVVAGCDIRDDVARLRDNDIASAILLGKSDTLISAERTARFSRHIPDIFALYDDPKANHLYSLTHPRETAMTHLQVLEALHKQIVTPQPVAA